MSKTPFDPDSNEQIAPIGHVQDCLPARLRASFVERALAKAVSNSTERAYGEGQQGTLERKRDQREAGRLAEELLRLPDHQARLRVNRSRGELYSSYLALELAQRAARIASSDASRCLSIVKLARLVLKRLPRRVRDAYQSCWWADIAGMLYSEEANAFRILRRLEEAREAFRSAKVLLRAGSGALDLQARYASLMGSYCWPQGHHWRAALALGHAANLFEEIGDLSQLGKVQLKQAGLLDSVGRVHEALSKYTTALAHLDEGDAEPIDVLSAHINLAEIMQRTGQHHSALSMLSASRVLLEGLENSRFLGVWYWVRGCSRISSGSPDGEHDLLAAWRILEPIGDTYSLGLIGVDLCRYYLDNCRFQELMHWVGPVVRALLPHAPSFEVTRELAKLEASVKRLTMDAAEVGETLRLVVKSMSQRARKA